MLLNKKSEDDQSDWNSPRWEHVCVYALCLGAYSDVTPIVCRAYQNASMESMALTHIIKKVLLILCKLLKGYLHYHFYIVWFILFISTFLYLYLYLYSHNVVSFAFVLQNTHLLHLSISSNLFQLVHFLYPECFRYSTVGNPT